MTKISFAISFIVVLWLGLFLFDCQAKQFDASCIPKGGKLLKYHFRTFVASDMYNDLGNALPIPDLSLLTCIKNQFEFYYGLTNSLIGIDGPLMAGILLDIEHARTSYVDGNDIIMTKVLNPWVMLNHNLLPVSDDAFMGTFSLRVKLPFTEIDPQSDEIVDMDNKQVDIYPVYYFDLKLPWLLYIDSQIGYKYRLKSGEIKPSDELRLIVETGYNIVPGIVYLFTISDYARFYGGDTSGLRNINPGGYLYTISAGARFKLGRDFGMEVLTSASPYGKNNLRGIGGHVGLSLVIGIP